MEKLEFLTRLIGIITLLQGMQNNAAAMKNSMKCLKKLKIELSNDPAIPLPGKYLEEWK